MDRLKEAKRVAGITTLIQQPARAFLGCQRVLSFQGRPPFFCEWAETSWDDPKLGAKMAWALTGEGGRPHTVLEWMQAIDPGITQLPDEEYEQKVRFK
jgi:hypothetical protein